MVSYREACRADIPDLQRIRGLVRENVLETRLTVDDYVDAITASGRGWVAEKNGKLIGFSIARSANDIWALFVEPEFEGQGVGRRLLKTATDWLFASGAVTICLTTEPGTRAEKLYKEQGWRVGDRLPNGDVRYRLNKAR